MARLPPREEVASFPSTVRAGRSDLRQQPKLRGRDFTYPVPPLGSSRNEDEWQHKATAVAIDAVRKATAEGAIPAGRPIGRLSETDLGWLVAAALFGWIQTRAEQAVTRGIDTELNIRDTGHDPSAWDAGTVAAILPKLARSRASTGRCQSRPGRRTR